MAQTKYRAQILLEPEQHQALAEVASRENRSISDVVREIIREWLAAQDLEGQRQRELQALEELTQIRMMIQEKHGVYPANLVDQVRAEKDEEDERVWRGEA